LVIGLLLKFVITFISLRITGGHRTVALGAAFCLAQFGEFSFVVGTEALANDVIDESLFQATIGASLLSLLATPFFVARSKRLATSVNELLVKIRVWKPTTPEEADSSVTISGHVVVIGFGPAGEEAARTVRLSGFEPYVLEMNPNTVKRIRSEGMRADIGDGSSREILEHAHGSDAAAFVVTIPDPEAAIAAVHQIRTLNAEAVVVVRARYSRRLPEIIAAGADHVLDEEATVGTLLGATVVKHGTGYAGQESESWPRPRDRAEI
ncbi:MAG: hypothetical protein GY895_16065, partial [Phycisphaera sp.]|nr:hypothetical protein [Phycisphaera sp.]